MTRFYPAMVIDVAPGSAGARCGVRAGDHLLAINGMPLRDVIDVHVYAGEPELQILFERSAQQRTCRVLRRYGEPLGIAFSNDIFEGSVRVCCNHCSFCFVAQMPPGLRSSLYLRDDDYRLSFLHGNYITLTNLGEADWDRIAEQHLSPLYISVHATEPEVRRALLRNPKAGQILAQLERLATLGIEMHTQAVLVPGYNDGEHLDRTISDLAALYPAVQDLTIVPVGLTKRHSPEIRSFTDNEVGRVLTQILAWQARLNEELGVRFVYPSDEWFLRAGVTVPEKDAYDGLLPAMIENGVGMVRRFLEGQENLGQLLAGLGSPQIWVTGTLFAPVLTDFAQLFSREIGIRVTVVPVTNHFFGESVTVAGLLTVGDILTALHDLNSSGAVILPAEMFRGPQGQSLDEQTPETVSKVMGLSVYVMEQRMGYNGTELWSLVPGDDWARSDTRG